MYFIKEETGKSSDLSKVPELSGTRSCDLGAGFESNSIIHQFYNLEKANGLSSLANLYSGEGAYEERLNAISGLTTPPAM